MPFTPLHMGPGLAVKALCGRHFSLTVFGFSQVMMDIEPLVRIIRGDTVLHGFTHTYLGATLIALASIFLGRAICQRLLDSFIPDPNAPFLNWLSGPKTITWPAATAGAVAGAYSHVVLDSIMHDDMQPFGLVSNANALLHVISVDSLHLLCIGSGLAFALILLVVYFLRARGLVDTQA